MDSTLLSVSDNSNMILQHIGYFALANFFLIFLAFLFSLIFSYRIRCLSDRDLC